MKNMWIGEKKILFTNRSTTEETLIVFEVT